ncbi:unnamed protein product [Medioppia subpectinata]|uniref:Uncharacterized protein n=1 Tax=Medioppia subpectinata TaxID=1979941 RepID=A0A7R9LXI9_9ACAR|nr:unnamed protein product [Medioppia subpectinata]CAG2122575.1 unnamed protein product [Medioppia subpectinata]
MTRMPQTSQTMMLRRKRRMCFSAGNAKNSSQY